MSNKNEYNEKQIKKDRALKAFATGAVLGIGLKTAHSSIGEKAFADTIDNMSVAAKALFNDVRETDFEDINAANTKKLINETKEAISDNKRNNALKNNVTSNSNIISYITEVLDITNRVDKDYGGKLNDYINKQYTLDNIISPTIKKFVDSNETLEDNDALRKKFTDFVIQAANQTDNELTVKEIYDNTLGDETEVFNDDFFKDVLEELKERQDQKKFNIDNYKFDFKDSKDEILDKLKNIDQLKKHFGEENKKANFLDKTLEDHALTVGDILNGDIRFNTKTVISKTDRGGRVSREAVDIKEALSEFKDLLTDEQKEEFDELYIDYKALRKSQDGKAYSRQTWLDAKDKAMKAFSETSIGTLLKTNDIISTENAPNILFTPGQSEDYILSLINKKDKTDAGYVKLFDKTYRMTTEGLEHIEELDGAKLVNKNSIQYKLLNNISGNVTQKTKHSNKYLRWLDVNQSGRESIFSIFKRKKIDPEYRKYTGTGTKENLTKNLLAVAKTEDLDDLTDEQISDIISNYKNINKFFEQETKPLNKSTVKKLLENTKSDDATDFFKYAVMNDDELIESFLHKEVSSLSHDNRYMNNDLKSLMSRYTKNPSVAKSTEYVKHTKDGKVVYSFEDLLRREVIKEGFLREAESGNVTKLIEKSDLKNSELKEANKLMSWAVLQYATSGFNNYNSIKNKELAKYSIENTQILIATLSDKNYSNLKDTIYSTVGELLDTSNAILYRDTRTDKNIIKHYNYNEWAYIKKAVSPLDYINTLNDKTKRKAFFKQFAAGKKDFAEDITSATLIPYFFTNRINEGMGRIGLGLSSESLTSAPRSYANLMLKRVLPAAIGMHYLSHANDMSKSITGTSTTGAFANSLAATDLGVRKFTDKTRLSSWFSEEKKVNPLLQYWTNSEDYQSYEERKEWYQDGYSPVRRGRFWSFGSLNEFRGSNIAYYQPNYLRRANSDWEDKLLYKSISQKWRHSPLPTITHPLSPAIFLANPYWLERQHKEDMPYPVTGPLFEQNTPWGAVLNPTVGRLIKPPKRMHRSRLGNSMIDVRSLIEARNMEIQQKAKDKNNSNVFSAQQGNVIPNDYVSISAPTPSERVLTITNHEGVLESNDNDSQYGNDPLAQSAQQPGSQYYSINEYDNAIDIKDYIENFDYHSNKQYDTDDQNKSQSISLFSNKKKQNNIAYNEIQQVNYNTQAKGVNNVNTAYTLTPESINYIPAKYGNKLLEDKNLRQDLKEIGTNKQYIEDALYSTSKMMGLYGYAANRIFVGDSVSYRLANSGDMTSISKRFWDKSLGGIGGSSGNLIMRFFPSSNKNIKDINPLMNTMPDWLPDRFRYGDPYKAVPKGGMRLPGKGYESLNDLHPDRFGHYGAFDRFKILADVAPYSREYKIWKDMAKKTTATNQSLQEEIKKIENRVTEQSKKHDFYPYKYKGRKVSSEKAVVEEVFGNNYFKILNDDSIYRMAGLNIISKENVLGKYLKPGMEIQLTTDADKHKKYNEDRYNSISAAVMVGNQNINNQLLKSKLAEKREDDSAAASIGIHSYSKVTRGKLFETISHADIPIIHDKFMRIESPLESYTRRNIYGTEYQSWKHPIQSYIKPGMEKSVSSGLRVAIGTSFWMLNIVSRNANIPEGLKKASNVALLMTNRSATVGAITSSLLKFSTHEVLKGNLKGITKIGADVGAIAGLVGYTYTRRDKPIQNAINMGIVGASIFSKFYDSKHLQSIAKPIVKEITKTKMGVAGAIIGATAGAALAGQQMSLLNKNKKTKYIPKRTKKRWEIEEYFDRLEYIKYTGLYNKAIRKAMREEGVDVKRLIRLEESRQKENEKTKEALSEEQKKILDLPIDLKSKMQSLKNIDNTMNNIDAKFELKGGKWARMALLYKDAANSTIYGLRENATWSQILRALPKNERDYFLEFVKEKDPKKRKKILKYVSPYQEKALKIAWEEKPKKQESNAAYFSRYRMPGYAWSGWRPDKDLADIKVKTIENEGMMLSDFGEYESRMAEPNVQHAEPINYDNDTNVLVTKKNLLLSLQGAGLTGVDIDMYPNNSGKIESIININRIKKYELESKIKSIFNRSM